MASEYIRCPLHGAKEKGGYGLTNSAYCHLTNKAIHPECQGCEHNDPAARHEAGMNEARDIANEYANSRELCEGRRRKQAAAEREG
jgi:hypothetical protein